MSNAVLLKNLGDKPSYAYGFLWADYIELKCLVSQDKLFSIGQYQDIQAEEGELQRDIEDDSKTSYETGLRNDDISNSKWEDIRRNFIFRASRLGENWPFSFEDDQLVLSFDSEDKSHVLYLTLLLCSVLKFCEKSRVPDLTSVFELLGYEVFKKIMPGWTVKPFGAHQDIDEGYAGNLTLAEKFNALKEDIKPRSVADSDDFDPRDTGDGGLDIVAFKNFEDELGNIPVAFAQCGCSPKAWEHKQFEASPSSMNSKITPQHPAANYYIMPHYFRDLGGKKWAKPSKVGDVILLDRERVLKILTDSISNTSLSKGEVLVLEAHSMNVSYFN